MKSFSRIASISIAILLLVAACGSKQKTNGGNDDDKGGVPADAAVAKAPEDLGMAKDSTVLAEDGSHVQMASAWINTHAVIIFLRGHW